ncbi:MAG: type II secretion system protein F [Proteobacteria bacterium]|nr:type II secretion system protein F [Pseudomonadota bacterium]NCV99519.1 type II secretion system protein F [Pseudomonadota bacterium]NCW37594.1 type II secretion system protein F [Pseudomonadota bacterium]NCX41989.1 type II secretion system protein F [Pseudomonadota bacterium]
MPTYNYIALNNNGSKKKGILSASSEREARKYIKDLQLTPISVAISTSRPSFRSKIKNKEIVLMTRQLATLLEANTSIVDALKITADQLNNKDLISIILNLREDVIQGKRLGQSMKKYPDVFNNTYSSLVTAGDSSGSLDLIFNKLADYLEESASIRQKVVSALTYPIILIGFSIVVIFALLTFVLPQVIGQFVKAGAELPLITNLLIGLSNNIFIIILFLAILAAFIIFGYRKYISNIENHISAHKKLLNLPLIGNFILISEIERFSSTMALIMESGTNLDVALEESSKVFNNKYLHHIVMNAKKDVVEGKDFIFSFNKTKVFPNIFMQLISSGYKSGNLVRMFYKASDFLRTEIDTKRSIFLSLLEPLVIIFMGGFIMLIVLAILIPIMQMNTLSLG